MTTCLKYALAAPLLGLVMLFLAGAFSLAVLADWLLGGVDRLTKPKPVDVTKDERGTGS